MRKKFCHIRKMNCSIWYISRKCLLAGKLAIIIFSNQNRTFQWKKNNYQCVFFLIIGRLWKQLILWINAIASCLPFAWIACSMKNIFISIGKIRKTNYLLVKWQDGNDRFWYLFAREWATSASSSRLFRIFLPLDRSGTLTESMACDNYYWICMVSFGISCGNFWSKLNGLKRLY